MTTTITEAGAHAAAAATDRIPALKTPFDTTGRGYLTPLQIATFAAERRTVATYAALTALTTATGLVDNGVYYTYARTTEEDGGAGHWRYDSASTATANGGTILAIDGGGAGRFFRTQTEYFNPQWFGAIGDGKRSFSGVATSGVSGGRFGRHRLARQSAGARS